MSLTATPVSAKPLRASTPLTQKRFKPQLSCTLCRARKIKCDRNSPCENCMKRELASSCSYKHLGIRNAAAVRVPQTRSEPEASREHDRSSGSLGLDLIRHASHQELTPSSIQSSEVARSIPDVVANNSHLAGIEHTPLRDKSEPLGRVSIEDKHPNYVGGAHWAEVFGHLPEQKGSFVPNEDLNFRDQPKSKPQGSLLLVGGVPLATKAELLASLPSRPVVDDMLSLYFESMEVSPIMIHGPTFMKQYERFWESPHEASIMWLGVLFAVLALAAYFDQISGKTRNSKVIQALRDPEEVVKMFHLKTVQCLILGNYTEPVAHTVECLMLYFCLETYRNIDTLFGTWIMFGIIVRTAMRMGYHRDARHFANISVLQGEMQRRLWAAITHLDIQTSSQVGLPRMIKEGMSDTQPPRNLRDEDFNESTSDLPPARPDSETTVVAYSLVRYRITAIFGRIVDQANSTNPVPYSEIMELDRLLANVNQQTPDWLSLRAIDDLNFEPSDVVCAQRILIDLCYQKARCILHRKFIVTTKLFSSAYSTSECVDASMRILGLHAYIHHSRQLKRSIHHRSWRTSILAHDFLLAAMLLCLYLQYVISTESISKWSAVSDKYGKADILEALSESYTIWEEESQTSREANKVAKALKRMLAKVEAAEVAQSSVISESTSLQSGVANGRDIRNSTYGISSSDAMTLQNQPNGTYSLENPLNPLQYHGSEPVVQGSIADANGDTVIDPSGFNWVIWDGYFQNNEFLNTPLDLLDLDSFLLTDSNSNLIG